ncbi:MAG: extracellular solute-binding protein [Proteobacteria bacterium]|nr:extracellular solute-binding protein [Pseudomonadota bacterium]
MKKNDFSHNELMDTLQSGKLSRRRFSQMLGVAGISLVATPMLSRKAMAGAADQATYFTWGGWDSPEYYASYVAKHGEPPNFATFGGSEEAFTKMRGGFVVDVAHPCNVEIPRWVESGLFQQLDTSKLSNWDDLIPQLWQLPGNVVDGKPYFAPFDWGQTSITYRTDLVDWQGGEESWSLLWDERYKGKIGQLGSAGDAWWCAAIYAGVDFDNIGSEENLEKVAALLRKQRPLIRTYTDDPTTLEQALASGELVAAMTWNSSTVTLKGEGVPVEFAKPKEGALTWVCGMMMHKDAPHPDRAHDIIDSLLSVERGITLITDEGYGHSNQKAIEAVDDASLASLGLTRNPEDTLGSGKFMVPQDQAFETASNKLYEEIKAGF